MKNNSDHEYTIIIGCGRLGSIIAGRLSEKCKDVMIIDSDKLSFRKLPPSYGGLTMIASATDIDKLITAQIDKATTFIAVSDSDNVNICAAQIAKKIFNVDKVIARINDEEKRSLLTPMNINVICPSSLSEREVEHFITWEAVTNEK